MMNVSSGNVAGGTRPLTEGEYRVGVTFNPSQNPTVGAIKQAAANLIDAILPMTASTIPETVFQADRAARMIEDAAMNAVKAATKAPR